MDELDRIRAQVTKTKDDSYEMHRNTMRKELQDISKSRVKNWPNTMEAQRLKREEDRITKLEDEEVSQTSCFLNIWTEFTVFETLPIFVKIWIL